ncbi:MAG: Dam family site-specific DNA-(adenine-N6)-methyltransferase [Bacteroidetes bacterium]|nr:Dam family site-specific DNA-(adenine-N6)-methyltransferase [Bacteroidota bacterium]MBT6686568.1 Dam family site-specific DNA-(adenine-N6)-methyltransferase [Bacteroidota bacterium]MBT7142931.1 Dam family site-specific DNA-(adenine-N6)-methyltransferase [Bacteroidota bacterium]MBT7490620.1 Dam family site-specific DNA-(adenine-N6)-methyltransferase [Bacteroidota bacterium]
MINNTKPFLRWAGGKRWLTKSILDFIPESFNNYHEPFIGGGSIFLFLKNQGLIKGTSYISDFNEDLINAYSVIRENPEKIISKLKTYKNDKEFYYKIRSQKPRSQVSKAVRFIYLNKTSYNGIYRVNNKGEYNVPFGYRKGENLFGFPNLLNLSKLLNDNVLLKNGDFDLVKKNIRANDLIFLDPPYTVAHENNGFIQYNQSIFKWEDQERLAELLKYINSKNAFYILTNASHNSIDELFKNIGKKHIVQRHSTIGGKGASRNRVNEFIFTNI